MQLKFRFASWGLWSFSTSFCVLVASLWAVSPVVRLFRNDCKPILSVYPYLLLLTPCAAVLLPMCLLWWLSLDDTSSQLITNLVKLWRNAGPFWNSILWCKSSKRTFKVISFATASAAFGVLSINWTIANPLVRCGSDQTALSHLMAAPFGLVGAVSMLYMEFSTPRYPVIYQTRLQQLQDRLIPSAATAILAWLAAAAISLTAYVLTPVPLMPLLDCVIALTSTFGYTLALILAGTLTSIILAERPSLAHASDSESSLVCDWAIQTCHHC
jgi:hypothetical protein